MRVIVRAFALVWPKIYQKSEHSKFLMAAAILGRSNCLKMTLQCVLTEFVLIRERNQRSPIIISGRCADPTINARHRACERCTPMGNMRNRE